MQEKEMNEQKLLYALIMELVELFDWSTNDPIHAVLHVKNAVRNIQCDLEVEKKRNQQLEEAVRGYFDALWLAQKRGLATTGMNPDEKFRQSQDHLLRFVETDDWDWPNGEK